MGPDLVFYATPFLPNLDEPHFVSFNEKGLDAYLLRHPCLNSVRGNQDQTLPPREFDVERVIDSALGLERDLESFLVQLTLLSDFEGPLAQKPCKRLPCPFKRQLVHKGTLPDAVRHFLDRKLDADASLGENIPNELPARLLQRELCKRRRINDSHGLLSRSWPHNPALRGACRPETSPSA